MNNSQYKYIGLDVHQATTSIAVLDGKGILLMEVRFLTQPGIFVPTEERENLMEEGRSRCRCRGTNRSRS